jgi:hypothetical protein
LGLADAAPSAEVDNVGEFGGFRCHRWLIPDDLHRETSILVAGDPKGIPRFGSLASKEIREACQTVFITCPPAVKFVVIVDEAKFVPRFIRSFDGNIG